jgi:hypothetical protein
MALVGLLIAMGMFTKDCLKRILSNFFSILEMVRAFLLRRMENKSKEFGLMMRGL